MAGFFKKLFNRIVGKPTEEVKPVEVEQVALPAPEPVIEVAAPKVEVKKPVAKKPEPKRPEPKKVEPKKVEKAKPVAKTSVKALAKAKSKVAAPSKKVEIKKPVAKAPAPKELEQKKQEPKAKPAPVAKVVVETERPPPRLTGRFAAFASAHPHRGEGEERVVTAPPPPPKTAPVPEPIAEAPARGGWFSRLKEGLSKSSKTITGSITAIFTKRKLDKETLQELEDTLIQADLGLAVSERIIAAVSYGRYDKEIDPEEVKAILASEVAKVLKPVEVPFNFGSEKPFVILVVGVNGSGKTTTIGKLGSIAASEGFKVMFAACDTFRAAAVEQLTVWGKRVGATTKSAPTGADSAGLAFDALKQAREDGTDILFIDTAGRLQNKAYLMDELDKVVRVIKKMDAAAPHAVLLVLDATTGQNALAQAEVFTKVAGVTGLIMTKLDGTARGGILVAIAEKFKLPIHAIGVGESIDDLQPFDAVAFSRAIAGFED
jgi:fused signal recognition particle receptor